MDLSWKQLLSDLLYRISIKLNSLVDLALFRSTCSPWRTSSTTLQEYSNRTRDFEKYLERLLPSYFLDKKPLSYVLGSYSIYKAKDAADLAFLVIINECKPGHVLTYYRNSSLPCIGRNEMLEIQQPSLYEVAHLWKMTATNNEWITPIKIDKVLMLMMVLGNHLVVVLEGSHLCSFNIRQNRLQTTRTSATGFSDIIARLDGNSINAVTRLKMTEKTIQNKLLGHDTDGWCKSLWTRA